jgi:PP-loop superfamily ATP-utilizing enzyme
VEALKRRGSILVALSGGVDSSVAALAFKALKDRAAAVTISPPPSMGGGGG